VPSIADNIFRNLRELGIDGVVVYQAQPDRLFVWDMLGQLEAHCKAHKEHWMADHLDPLHGGSARANYREKATPSMQCVKHAISQINHPNLPRPEIWEVDFDEVCPRTPITIIEHLDTCIIHAIRGSKTDQNEISKGLDKRYPKEQINT
jgi:hypothetical protein